MEVKKFIYKTLFHHRIYPFVQPIIQDILATLQPKYNCIELSRDLSKETNACHIGRTFEKVTRNPINEALSQTPLRYDPTRQAVLSATLPYFKWLTKYKCSAKIVSKLSRLNRDSGGFERIAVSHSRDVGKLVSQLRTLGHSAYHRDASSKTTFHYRKPSRPQTRYIVRDSKAA
ncbi:unnamed protein product [Callosobruchus maculatus]|uniref:Uncharacterized protein n=1 Tax=Callosobruchus maculatus TaxID=64391 RepID=A0A653C0W5_CALMS|nr:unnamed protein product [Callosobruchus maculatus]